MANKDYFKKLNAGRAVAFMEGREKGDKSEILDEVLYFEDFAFINGENGECAVAIFTDKPNFYFMNSVVTDMLHEIDADGMREELKEQPIRFTMRENQKGTREYLAFEFIDV